MPPTIVQLGGWQDGNGYPAPLGLGVGGFSQWRRSAVYSDGTTGWIYGTGRISPNGEWILSPDCGDPSETGECEDGHLEVEPVEAPVPERNRIFEEVQVR